MDNEGYPLLIDAINASINTQNLMLESLPFAAELASI